VEDLRQAVEQGSTPSGLDFADDDSIVVLRFTRPRASDAHLMVSVEYSAEENEVVGKVYDAGSRVKHATGPSGRATPACPWGLMPAFSSCWASLAALANWRTCATTPPALRLKRSTCPSVSARRARQVTFRLP